MRLYRPWGQESNPISTLLPLWGAVLLGNNAVVLRNNGGKARVSDVRNNNPQRIHERQESLVKVWVLLGPKMACVFSSKLEKPFPGKQEHFFIPPC